MKYTAARLAEQLEYGDFLVLEKLAEGGMGITYKVIQQSTRRVRVLKVMKPEMLRHAKARERFHREITLPARIKSDHIPDVIASALDAEPPWFVMEFLDGKTLADYLDGARATGEHLALSEVRHLMSHIFHAVVAAHAADVVHRDLKPENILLAQVDQQPTNMIAKIIDFGIAKDVAEPSPTASLFTAFYAAPEQLASSTIDHRADIWSIGLIAFEMLTFQKYWLSWHQTGRTDQERFLRWQEEIKASKFPKASDRATQLGVGVQLPKAFDEWFARCVSPLRKRYSDAAIARDALMDALAESPTALPPVNAPKRWPALGVGLAIGAGTSYALSLLPATKPQGSNPAELSRSNLEPRPSAAAAMPTTTQSAALTPKSAASPPPSVPPTPSCPDRMVELSGKVCVHTHPVRVGDFLECVSAGSCDPPIEHSDVVAPRAAGARGGKACAAATQPGVELKPDPSVNCVTYANAAKFCAWGMEDSGWPERWKVPTRDDWELIADEKEIRFDEDLFSEWTSTAMGNSVNALVSGTKRRVDGFFATIHAVDFIGFRCATTPKRN